MCRFEHGRSITVMDNAEGEPRPLGTNSMTTKNEMKPATPIEAPERCSIAAGSTLISERLPREADGFPCPCGGYADRVDCTPAENEKHGCGRSWECCSRAFVCRVCKKRLVGTAESPEME